MTQSEKSSRTLHRLASAQALAGAGSCFAAAYEQAQGTYDTSLLILLWAATLTLFLLAAITNTKAKRTYR